MTPNRINMFAAGAAAGAAQDAGGDEQSRYSQAIAVGMMAAEAERMLQTQRASAAVAAAVAAAEAVPDPPPPPGPPGPLRRLLGWLRLG